MRVCVFVHMCCQSPSGGPVNTPQWIGLLWCSYNGSSPGPDCGWRPGRVKVP